jgi:hypothetical protein
MARGFSVNRRRIGTIVVSVLAVTAALVPGAAQATDFHATPSTFASMFSQAQAGDTVYLASGSYGSWNGGAKSGMVTVAADAGASASMAGGSFGSSVRNITIKGVTFTGPVEVAPGSTPLNLVFDGDTWGNVGHAAHEGRLSIVGGGSAAGNGVQVKNSTFGPGGCSDGIQDSSSGTEIGPNNEFKGIVQGGCSEHADAIQPYASNYIYIHDNYLHDNEQGIMSPDGVSTGYRITNNVIHTATGYPCMHLGDTRSGSVTHNVCRNGQIRVYGGNQNQASQNMVVRDNGASIDASACSGCTIDHNQTVTYTNSGSGRCAYATASPKGTASDGTDIGLNSCGATQPPPPPPPPSSPPPADTTAPDTSITSGPADPTTSTSASFSFTATESGSTFQCKLDSGAYAACASPKAYTGLSAATHSFSVRATDPAGNNDASPAMKTWTVQGASAPPPSDHQPAAAYTATPASPTAGKPVSFDASGATCADTPCTYAWEDDGPDGSAGDQWPLGSGRTMSFTFQEAGVKNVRLNVTDADGDKATTMKAITVAAAGSKPPPADTTAPNTTITSGPTGTTTDNTPTFTFSASESGSTFQCRLDSGAWAGCTSPWTTSAVTDGMHAIAVRAIDPAGNIDATPASQSFTVAAAAAPQTLVGDATVQSSPDSNGAGTAEAFRATASASGTTAKMSVYVATGNSAGTMVVGIYSDADGHPGTLLTKGTKTGLGAGAWNTVTVPAASISSAKPYWVALLGTGGTLRFRGGSASDCRSEGSRSSTLSTLPSTWASGATWGTCPPSAYATS